MSICFYLCNLYNIISCKIILERQQEDCLVDQFVYLPSGIFTGTPFTKTVAESLVTEFCCCEDLA